MNHLISRDCPVCLSAEKKLLFPQQFESFSEGALLSGYDLVLCKDCGAVFADQIPDQKYFDKYYREMSKYEYGFTGGNISFFDDANFKKIADLLVPHLGKETSIADVGCATGALLNEFKQRGFQNVTGFDPSAACCEVGRRLYGIDMKHSTINQLSCFSDRFDVVITTGVLEHLCDVESSLASLKSLLKSDGKMLIGVPDASRYDRHFGAPFQYFSMEHINFFAPQSLENLMYRHGYAMNFVTQYDRYLGPNSVEPVMAGLFSPVDSTHRIPLLVRDEETEESLELYIRQSREVDKRINQTIDRLVLSQAPILVWAVGTHTLRLLKTSSLPKANIVAFIDSNKNYQGKLLNGIPILPPEKCHDIDAAVLISSQVAESEIVSLIYKDLHWDKSIHTLYTDIS